MPSSAWSDPSRDLHSFPTRRSSDLDLVELLVRGIVGLVAGEQELAASDDHGEHVVEVVRDAAREPPDRFDLLELAHLVLALTQDLLGALALGDVPAHPGDTAHVAVLAGERGARPLISEPG